MEAHSDKQDFYTGRSRWDACRSLSDRVLESEEVTSVFLQGTRGFGSPVMVVEGQLEEKEKVCMWGMGNDLAWPGELELQWVERVCA